MDFVTPLRVAIIGTAKRSNYLYGPLIKALSTEVELVAVWGRSQDSVQQLSASLNVPGYTDIVKLVHDTEPHIGIVSVNYHANGEVGLMAVEAGLNVLLETPIAHNLAEADKIIVAAETRGLKIEVAEQFHRRPLEQIKLKLIALGLFGRVHTSFNDFSGHGYHGMSVLRSYLGFDVKPTQIVGSVQQYDLAAHWSRLNNTYGLRSETQEHGIIEFDGGQLGIFHWSDVAYDSALRWWRSSRFLGEKGMGISVGVGLDYQERLSLLRPDRESPDFITLERRWDRVDGGALVSIVAHTGLPEMPSVTWDNPVRSVVSGYAVQWHDDEIGIAGCLFSLINAIKTNTSPTYGAQQARLDQELILALNISAKNGGQPIKLPLDPTR